MTSEAVFIQVGALADGFAPHGNLLATASLSAQYPAGRGRAGRYADRQRMGGGSERRGQYADDYVL